VLGVIDSWTICDTGSTDSTPSLVEKLFGHLPGRLLRHDWVDFGTDRSVALAAARGTADYLLLLDADHVIRLDRPLPHLDAEAYTVLMEEETSHWLPRLIRGDMPWRYQGATHEFLTPDRAYTSEPLDQLVVVNGYDGGASADKFTRDRALLEADLARQPDDPRTNFYLAQTYLGLGDKERALATYRRRVELGGWDEEVFYSKFQVAGLLAAIDPPQSVAAFLEAWEYRPTRAEPLYELAHRYREERKYHLAYHLAAIGRRLAVPSDVLFVHRWVYEWGMDFEWSIAAYWVGDLHAALSVNDELLLQRTLPQNVRDAVVYNRQCCLTALDASSAHSAV